MTPQEYGDYLTSLELQEVTLDQIEAQRLALGDLGRVSVSITDEMQPHESEGELRPAMAYTVSMAREEDGAPVLNLKAAFSVRLNCPTPAPEGFFEMYEPNLRSTTLPYLRELLASITGRMGMAVMTMPYIIFNAPVPPPEELPAAPAPKAAPKKPRKKPAKKPVP